MNVTNAGIFILLVLIILQFAKLSEVRFPTWIFEQW